MKTPLLAALLVSLAGAGHAASATLAIFDQLIARQEQQASQEEAQQAEIDRRNRELDRVLAAPAAGAALAPSRKETRDNGFTHPDVSQLLGKLDGKATGLVIRGGQRLWLTEVYSEGENCQADPRAPELQARLAPGRDALCLAISQLQDMTGSHDIRLAGKVDIPFQAFSRPSPTRGGKS